MDELGRIRERKMRKMIDDAERMRLGAAGRVEIATDASFDSLTSSAPLSVVDFWAKWCGPCRMVSPIVEELAKEYAGKVLFCKLNVDENASTAQRFGIMSIPTLVLMKNGKVVDTIVGAVSKAVIQDRIARYV